MICRTYDTIENTAPRMVFINYIQASKLKPLIEKYQCPKLISTNYKVNVRDDKNIKVSVELSQTKNNDKMFLVLRNDWGQRVD